MLQIKNATVGNSTETEKKKPMRVLMKPIRKIENSTDAPDHEESQPVGPPIAEPIKLNKEMKPTVAPTEALEMMKLVQDSIKKKTNPLDQQQQQQKSDPNKKPVSQKNETVLVVSSTHLQPKVKLPVQSAIKSGSKPAKPQVELKNKKPVPTVKSIKPDKTVKSEQKQNKPAIVPTTTTTTTAKPSSKLPATRLVTQNLRGYKKRTQKVKPVAHYQHNFEQNKKSEPALVSAVELPEKSVKPPMKAVELKEKPANKPIGSDQKGVRCSRFGTC